MNKQLLRTTSFIAAAALIASCFWAAPKISIVKSFVKLWPDPWFKLTILDLYLGFILFSAFIIRREKSIIKSILWVIAMGSLGNIASFLYLFLYTFEDKNNRSLWEPKRETWTLF